MFKKFPYFFNSLKRVATLYVTFYETTRMVSLSDCRIYGTDDCNRCLQSSKRAGYMEYTEKS